MPSRINAFQQDLLFVNRTHLASSLGAHHPVSVCLGRRAVHSGASEHSVPEERAPNVLLPGCAVVDAPRFRALPAVAHAALCASLFDGGRSAAMDLSPGERSLAYRRGRAALFGFERAL